MDLATHITYICTQRQNNALWWWCLEWTCDRCAKDGGMFSLNIRGGSIIYWFLGSYTEYYLIVVPSRLSRFLLLAVEINAQLHWPHSKAIPPARFLIISRNIHGIWVCWIEETVQLILGLNSVAAKAATASTILGTKLLAEGFKSPL